MNAVTDPLWSWNWEVVIPFIPGVADSREMTVRAVSANLPGWAIEQMTWEAHARKRRFAGKLSYDDTWEMTAIETRDMKTRDMLTAWRDAARSWQGEGAGGYSADYAVPVELGLYDDKNLLARSVRIVNVFPLTLGQVQMDQGTGIVTYTCGFSMDYFEDIAA
jgi:hypothetical protein